MNELVRKRILALIVCTAWVICLAPAHATSFDCAQARSVFERMVCGDERLDEGLQLGEDLRKELLKLDEELNAVYREVLSKHFDPELLKREQRLWLAARERCAREMNVPCNVFHLYHDRIDNLRYDLTHPPHTNAEREAARLLSMGSPPGDNFAISRQATFKGYGMEICEALVRWLNHTTPKGDMVCAPKLISSMPGVSEPAWQELDVSQHVDLFGKIIQAEFGEIDMAPKVTPEDIGQELEVALARGDKLWMIREDIYHDHNKGKHEIIVLHQKNQKYRNCPLTEKWKWGTEWVVTDNLHDVDKDSSNRVIGPRRKLLYYKGGPYFIGSSPFEATVSNDSFRTFCEIDNIKSERRQQ